MLPTLLIAFHQSSYQTQSTYWATNYFCQPAKRIAMPMAAHTVASCGEQFCDRQAIFTRVPHFDSEKALVIDIDVTVSVRLIWTSKTISRFRSWKTSQLFIKPGLGACCALLTWTRCSRSGSSRRPGLC
jgi:hypothetical protein